LRTSQLVELGKFDGEARVNKELVMVFQNFVLPPSLPSSKLFFSLFFFFFFFSSFLLLIATSIIVQKNHHHRELLSWMFLLLQIRMIRMTTTRMTVTTRGDC
jgi:hypothetical protein